MSAKAVISSLLLMQLAALQHIARHSLVADGMTEGSAVLLLAQLQLLFAKYISLQADCVAKLMRQPYTA